MRTSVHMCTCMYTTYMYMYMYLVHSLVPRPDTQVRGNKTTLYRVHCYSYMSCMKVKWCSLTSQTLSLVWESSYVCRPPCIAKCMYLLAVCMHVSLHYLSCHACFLVGSLVLRQCWTIHCAKSRFPRQWTCGETHHYHWYWYWSASTSSVLWIHS